MLAEVRALGEGIVIADQLPTAMAPEVIKNTSLKIGLRITAKDDRELLGGTMNANLDRLEKLSIFNPGHAIVSYEPLLKPFEVQLPYFEAKEGDLSDKTVLTAMLKGELYIGNIRRSIDISSEKWKAEADRIRHALKNAIAGMDAIDAKSAESTNKTELRRMVNEKNALFETAVSLKKEAEKLSLSIIAYVSSLMFITGVKSPSENVQKTILGIIRDIVTYSDFANSFYREILGIFNAYRVKHGHPEQLGSSYFKKRDLFLKSTRKWKDM